MRRFTLIMALSFIITQFVISQTTIVYQSFEGSGDNWSYTPNPAAFTVGSDVWDIVDDSWQSSNLTTMSTDGTKFWGIQDLANGNGGTATGEWGDITFASVSVSSYTNVSISFDYEAYGFDTGDDMKYEAFFDGVSQGEVALISGGTGGVSGNGSISIPVTPGTSSVYLVISCKQNGGSDYGGWDNFKVIGTSGGNNPPAITNISQTPSTDITSSTTVSVSADVTDSDGTVAGVELHWGTTSGSLGTTISMSNTSGDTYTTDSDIPAQADGTTIYYEIYALDDDADDNTSPEQSYTVTDPATTTLPYSETFDADLGDCYTYSVSGDTKYWTYGSYGSNGFADMNGYNSGETEEDWLVLPGIDFDSYTYEIMSFDTWYNYGNDNTTNYLKLYYSADYPGIGDPTGYTWTELNFTQGSSDAWTSSGYIDLSSITGTSVYIAFKYHYEAGNYRHWEVDNISIVESLPINVTFQVNMTDETVSGSGVHVAGNFNNWDPAITEMLDGDSDDIYDATFLVYSNVEYQFKYINGNDWQEEESVPAECQAPGTSNRFEVIGSTDYSIDPVCFSSCADCGTLQDYDITFRVNMQNETVTGNVNIAGSFNGWTNEAMTNTGGTIWEITKTLQEGSYLEYKFKNGDSWESITGSCVNGDGNRELTVPSANTTLDLVCFNSCDACLVASFVIINEVDADTPGSDTQEFIELYDGGIGNTNLAGLVVVLFNGSDDKSYNPAIDLDGYFTNSQGYFVIGSTGMGTDIEIDPGSSGWLQNGPDAVALFIGDATDFPNDTPVTDINLLDALVYDTNDGDDAGLLDVLTPGQPQINEDGRGDKDNHSNQRIPNGSGGQRITSTYDQSPPTTGVENIGIYADWTGTVDNDWDNSGNWSNGIVPDATINVTIPDVAKAAFPVISGSATCANLTMAAGSSLDISPSGALTVLGTFANNGGNLTIKSDATGTGSLIENNGVYATTERFLSQNKWHYVATPIDDANTGVYTGLYMMYWDEPAWLWKWVLSADSTLAVDMQGYALWSDDADATVSYTGALNTGSKTINLTNTSGTGSPDYSGFNLVGNPYPSSVNWNNDDGSGWTRTNMDMTVWVWNHSAGNYGSYVKDEATGTNGVDSILAPQQGFMVHCNSTGGGSLSVDNSARVHSSKDILKAGKSSDGQYMLLKVDGNGYSDEVMISQNYNSSYNFDINDGLKLYGRADAPQLYTISSDGEELSINSIPALVSSNLTIPMNFRAGIDGEFTITLNDIEGFENTPLYLEDLQLGTISEITNDFVYNFKASADDAENRFLLHFSDVETPPVNGGTSMLTNVSIYSYDKTIYLFSKENISGIVKVYDLTGKIVMQKGINETTAGTIKDSSLKGFYIVTLTTNDGVEAQKVYIK